VRGQSLSESGPVPVPRTRGFSLRPDDHDDPGVHDFYYLIMPGVVVVV